MLCNLWVEHWSTILEQNSQHEGGPRMPKKTVEFDAHKTVKRPTKVSFETKKGEKVRFVAEKPGKVPIHVKFKAKKD